MPRTGARRHGARLGALAAGAAGIATAFITFAAPPAVAGGVPFSDPQAHGAIGLCNGGHQITHGRVAAAPFVTRAVSAVPAAKGYDVPGRTATLFAYQPLQNVPAGDWSGSQLTSSTRYSLAAHPTAAGTPVDTSLADFTRNFHPAWDGLLELRLLLSAPGKPADTLSYPAAVIRVSGHAWRVVGSAPKVDCRAGQAVSLESLLLPKKEQLQRHARHPSGDRAGKGVAPSSGGRAAGSRSARDGVTVSPAAAVGDSSPHGHGHGEGGRIAALLAAVALLTGLAGYAGRRRRAAPQAADGQSAASRSLAFAASSADDQKGLHQ